MLAFSVKSQQRFPYGFPTQTNTGWTKWGYSMSDSGLVVANRDTNWLAKYSGTIVFKPSNKQFYWFDSTNLRWNLFGTVIDTASIINRINLKLNITDTTAKWWGIGKRWVDTVYRVNDSTIGFTINNGAQQTFEIKGGASGGGGGSGTVTSVALSMPSAFTVTGSPITSSGTFSVAGAGTTTQYIRGNGTLATTDTTMIPNFHLKVRSLITGTSPIIFNQTTGGISILNANISGQKGAASFNSASFLDNGSGLISLSQPVPSGACINCDITWGSDGRPTSYASGTPPQFVNAPGAGDTLSILDTLKRLNNGYGILHVVTANNITHSADTSSSNSLVTQYDLSLKGIATLNNIGTGFAWAATPSGNIKRVAASNTILWDSTSTVNTLTAKADTSILATQYDLTQINISYTDIAYVDSAFGNNSTGLLNRADKPFSTIDAALDAGASRPSLHIIIGFGSYASPTPAKMRNYLWLEGSGKPGHNGTVVATGFAVFSNTAPTQLKGGTILRGTLQAIDRQFVKYTDLGVDCGAAYVAGGGTEGNCIGIGSLTSTTPFTLIQGIEIRNVICLGLNPTSLFHAVVLENCFEPILDNITTIFATHGIVGKNIGGIYTNLHCHDHHTDGIVLKSNSYAFGWRMMLNNFEVSTTFSSDCGGVDLFFENGPAFSGVFVENGVIAQTNYGLNVHGAVDNLNVTDVYCIALNGPGFTSTSDGFVYFINCGVRGAVGDGFNVNKLTGITFINGGFSYNCTGDAYDLNSTGDFIQVENISAAVNTGFGIRAGSNVYVGEWFSHLNTAGASTGTLLPRRSAQMARDNIFTATNTFNSTTILNNVSAPISTYNVLVHGLTDSIEYQIPSSTFATGNTLYTGDGTIAGNRNVNVNNLNLTFSDVNSFRINHDVFALSKADGTFPFSSAIVAPSQELRSGYTPTVGNFSKGAAVSIDTNNNVSLGTGFITSSHPLYTFGSAFAQGLTSARGNFYRVDSYSANQTLSIEQYFINVDASGGAVTITLPAASTAFGSGVGIRYIIRKTDASGNAVTIQRNGTPGTDTINGAASVTLAAQYDAKGIQAVSTSAFASLIL